jgi:hypothetical protein
MAPAPLTHAEPVLLADGEALQGLLPGVEPIGQAARQIAAVQASRAARRGNAPLPAGSLFDEVARDQGDLFG